MIARFSGASLGLLAFCVTVLAGVYVQNPVTTTLSRGILALFLFFVIGFALGLVADTVVNEHECAREDEADKQKPPHEVGEPIELHADGVGTEVGAPVNV